jgi:hypothetical protein
MKADNFLAASLKDCPVRIYQTIDRIVVASPLPG